MGSAKAYPELPMWLGVVIRYFFTGQLLLYWVLSYRELTNHKKRLLSVASSIEHADLSWLKNLLVTSLVMIAMKVIPAEGKLNSIIPLVYFAGMILLAYYSIRQQSIYSVELASISLVRDDPANKEIWERLESEQVDELKQKVLRITLEHKLYLDPSLTLPALSTFTGIGVQDLSYVLNNGLKKNFYQFINELRVEEAKKLLQSDMVQTLDMLGIATHAGFNSKTTFNTTFKKITGLTPSQFQKSPYNAAVAS